VKVLPWVFFNGARHRVSTYAVEAEAVALRFANMDIVEANEEVVLIAPFDSTNSTNRWSSPDLDEEVSAMW
jgi:hypothetical protein